MTTAKQYPPRKQGPWVAPHTTQSVRAGDLQMLARNVRRPSRFHATRPGFSLMEVLVLVVVIAIVGAGAGKALQDVCRTPVLTDQIYQLETQLISKMESIRAMTFDSIAVGSPNSTLSDIITVSGTTYQRTVTVALADANADGTNETTFKLVTVTCGGQSISTMIAR